MRVTNGRLSRLSSSFRLRRHIHELVPLKHCTVEVPAAVVVRLSADRCGDATRGEGGNHGAQRQRFPGGRRRSGSRCGGSLLLGGGSLLLGSGGLLLSRGRLLLGLGYLGRIRRVDGGPYHDGRAASDAKNRLRFGHQVHGQKRDIGHEHHDKGTGYYCNPA